MAVYCLISMLLAWGTFYLIRHPSITPTRASSLLSLITIGILFIINRVVNIEIVQMSALAFGASFVGMCSHKKVGDLEVIFAGFVFAFVFIYFTPKLSVPGIGGALGFSAFVSVLISRGVYWVCNYKKIRRSM